MSLPKIALIGPSHPYRGGIAHYTASLYKALAELDAEPLLINFKRLYPDMLFPGKTQLDTSTAAISVPGQQLLDSMNPLSWYQSAKAIVASGAGVAIFQWWHPFFAPAYGTMIKHLRKHNIFSVFICHNVLPHESGPFTRILLKNIYRKVDHFIVQAKSEGTRLTTLTGQTEYSVYPHPPYDIFETKNPPSKLEARQKLGIRTESVLLFFGFIRAYKGLNILLEAFSRLENKQNATLVIAGECYEDPRKYQAQIDRLRIGDRVLFPNRYVANEELSTLFAAADVCVLPYLDATQSGVVQLSHALSTPVIVSAVGGIPEVVHDGQKGLLVIPGDVDDLVQKINRFYKENLESQLIYGIKSKNSHLSWMNLAKNICTFVTKNYIQTP